MVLTNPDPNLSNDEYKAHLARLVQQQQEKELRVAKRKEREKERQRTQELIKAGLIEPPQSARKSPVTSQLYKRDGRGRPRKNFDELPPAPISVPTNAAQEAPLTNNKKARFTSANTTLDHQQQQQQQQLQLQQRQRQQQQKDVFEIEHQLPRTINLALGVVVGISYEDIENERVVEESYASGHEELNSKVNSSTPLRCSQRSSIPNYLRIFRLFALKMSVNDAEREKVLTQIAMRRVFNEFARRVRSGEAIVERTFRRRRSNVYALSKVTMKTSCIPL